MVGDVGAVAGVALGPTAGALSRIGQGNQSLVNQRRARGHGILGGQHGRQDFPIHADQSHRFLGQVGRVGGDGGDGVATVQRLFAGHHVAAVEAVVDRCALFLVLDFGGNVREVGGGYHGVDAGQGQGAAGVDAADASVGVGAAQNFAVEHTGQVDVGGVAGAAHHLVRPVVADGAGPDDLIVFIGVGQDDVGFVVKHKQRPP